LVLAACAETAGMTTQTPANTASKTVEKERSWRIAIFDLQQIVRIWRVRRLAIDVH
jgi:hypothetical protein